MKRILLVTILLILFGQTRSQIIDMGQKAEDVKALIEWTTRDHNKPDSFGNLASSRATTDVKYENGEIKDVIQCFEKQFIIEFGLTVNYCKHYLMKNGKLSYILTQYENVSTEKLITQYSRTSNKIGEYFFDNDFEHFSKIFLGANKLATVEYRKTKLEPISNSIRSQIEIIKSNKEEERKTKLKNDYDSKVFTQFEIDKNVELYNESSFKKTLNEQFDNYFKNNPNEVSYNKIVFENLFGSVIELVKSDQFKTSIVINKDGTVNNSDLRFSPGIINSIPVKSKVFLKLGLPQIDRFDITLLYIDRARGTYNLYEGNSLIDPSSYKYSEISKKIESPINEYNKSLNKKIDSLNIQLVVLKTDKKKSSKPEILKLKKEIKELTPDNKFAVKLVSCRLTYMILDSEDSSRVLGSDGMDLYYVLDIKPVRDN